MYIEIQKKNTKKPFDIIKFTDHWILIFRRNKKKYKKYEKKKVEAQFLYYILISIDIHSINTSNKTSNTMNSDNIKEGIYPLIPTL